MRWLEFLAWAFAVHAVLEVWFEGSIFAGKRAAAEANAAAADEMWLEEESQDRGVSLGTRWLWFSSHVVGCRLCLSVWVSSIAGLLMPLPAAFLPDPWRQVVLLPVYAFGALGLLQLTQALIEAHGRRSTDRPAGP